MVAVIPADQARRTETSAERQSYSEATATAGELAGETGERTNRISAMRTTCGQLADNVHGFAAGQQSAQRPNGDYRDRQDEARSCRAVEYPG